MTFGKELRDALAPKIQLITLEEVKIDGVWMYALPDAVITEDGNGTTSVYIPKESEKYPELRYTAVALQVEPIQIGEALFVPADDLPIPAKVILGDMEAVRDGMVVVIE